MIVWKFCYNTTREENPQEAETTIAESKKRSEFYDAVLKAATATKSRNENAN